MNRVQFSRWLNSNALALTAVVPVILEPGKFDIAENEQVPFLRGVTFGIQYAARLASSSDLDFEKMATNANFALDTMVNHAKD